MHRLQGLAVSVALVLAFTAATLRAVTVDWATGTALGAVAVSFDGEVKVFYDLYGASPGAAASESISTGGSSHGLAFDNALNLYVGNDAPAFRILKLGEKSAHAVSTAYTTGASVRALAFAGDGTLYAASPGGQITRFPVSGPPVTFTVRTDSTACIGIDLAADGTLYSVSGGRNVFALANAGTASGNQVASTTVFAALSGGATACGIRLLPPERGAATMSHGGMLIAEGRSITRLAANGAKLAEFKLSGGNQAWVDVAVDPRMVFPGLTGGTEPAEYVFWGIEQNSRVVARFQTDRGPAPLQTEATVAVPRGLAVNGELRVAQVVRRVTLGASAATVSFLDGTPYRHTWGAQDAGTGPMAVMTYEARSNGSAETTPLAGLCAPGLDVDCRFVDYFSYMGGTPRAIDYSRGRSVVYRAIPSSTFVPPPAGAKDQVLITYPGSANPAPDPSCAASSAASLLRDRFLLAGHDQFDGDDTNAFFGSDHGVRDGTDVLGGTDYVVALRADTRFASYLAKPDPFAVTSVQVGSSLPIQVLIRQPGTCEPVGGLANVLVLTATELRAGSLKGEPLGDSLTPGSLGSVGLAPWEFTDGLWRTNLALDPAKFLVGNQYVLCINARAVNNSRAFGETCATIAIVKGSGKKKRQLHAHRRLSTNPPVRPSSAPASCQRQRPHPHSTSRRRSTCSSGQRRAGPSCGALWRTGMDPEVVVVTGASSGVGRAVARAYGARRARVALLARNADALEACAAEIRAAGGEPLVCQVDVSDAAAVERAAALVEQRWERIDVWVNVAMATVFAPVRETTAEEFRRVTEVTYLGYVHGTLSALRRMLPRDAGTIVQVGSALAYRSIPLQSAYCAAKAAIRAFTDSLRCELIHDGSRVRVTQVHLPAVNTPQSERQRNKMPKQQQPVPPMFTPESIAEAILSAADRAPREMLVGWPTTKAVVGQKFIPGLLDRFLAHAAWEPQFVDAPNEQSADVLFETLPGDPGAHGPYRDRERGPDLQMRLQQRPAAGALLFMGAGMALAATIGSAMGRVDGWCRSAGWRTAGAAGRP